MSLHVEGVEGVFNYSDTPDGDCLRVTEGLGGVVFENDPDVFAVTPEVIVSSKWVSAVLDFDGVNETRRYLVVGVTRHGDLVVKKLEAG